VEWQPLLERIKIQLDFSNSEKDRERLTELIQNEISRVWAMPTDMLIDLIITVLHEVRDHVTDTKWVNKSDLIMIKVKVISEWKKVADNLSIYPLGGDQSNFVADIMDVLDLLRFHFNRLATTVRR